MQRPRLDAPIADEAPASNQLTPYDEIHVIHYLILLDADRENAPWEEVAREALRIDPAKEPARVRRTYETHLARAKWMTEVGWRHILNAGPMEDTET